MNFLWLALLGFVALLTAVGHVLFKMAAVGDPPLTERLKDIRFLAGCFVFALAPGLTFLAARHVDFSLLYAITALNFPFVMILARLVLKEPVDRSKLLGVAGILLGLGLFLWL